jgi:hypothetical protein
MLGELMLQLNKKEITVIADGKVKGMAVAIVVTYWNIKRADGTYCGEGQGIITPKERRNGGADGQSLTVYEYGVGKDSGQTTLWKDLPFIMQKTMDLKRINYLL